MENVLQIPRITNTTIKYFVDGEFIDNVTVDEVNKIRENIIEYIIKNEDKSILDRFYFIGHKDLNAKPGEEIKITMDVFGNFSDSSWEMNHIRRSMNRLIDIERSNHELLKILV